MSKDAFVVLSDEGILSQCNFNKMNYEDRTVKKWKMVWCGGDPSNAKVFGVFIENYPHKYLDETVTVEEPRYHQKFHAFKYEVEINGQKKVFATTEYSMGIYMYFVEE